MQKGYSKLTDILLPLLIFLAAFLLRYYHIELLPINHDEASWARFLLMNPQYVKDIFGIPISSFFPPKIIVFLSEYLPGSRVISLGYFMLHVRFQPVVIGAATVSLLYILAKSMYGRKVAVVSSLVLCFLPWHVIQSSLMLRVIWIPFYGCLIYLSLFNSTQARTKISSIAWALSSCLFLWISINSYESAMLFVPIFFISLIALSNSRRINLTATFIFFLFILYYSVRAKDGFWNDFYRGYQKNIFEGFLLSNIMENIRNNAWPAIRELFFNFNNSAILYGKALNAPLFIHPVTLFFVVLSIAIFLIRRAASDRIILIWFFLGLLGALAGVNFFQPRYIFIVLIPLVIFIGKLFADIFSYLRQEKSSFKSSFLYLTMAVIYIGLIVFEIAQLARYYRVAPFDLNECRHNSYGCKEAAEYLSRVHGIRNCNIYSDNRMTVDVYLNYYLLKKSNDRYFDTGIPANRIIKEDLCAYYIIWAPQSHSRDYWDGQFSDFYYYFKLKYPETEAVKTIYYPGGLEAIHIYKVKENNDIK